MNTVNLIGRLTADPELKTTQSGVSVSPFTVAVDRQYTPKGEEKIADFINCVAWKQTAEVITSHFRKGQRIGIVGSLQSRKYQTRDGENRTAFEVHVSNVSFCESKRSQDAEPPAEYYAQPSARYHADPSTIHSQAQPNRYEIVSDEKLPF